MGHNLIGYDLPVLHRLGGEAVSSALRGLRTVDTLVISRLLDFGQSGGHSLARWGEVLGISKGEFKGPWDEWTQEMEDYCVQDTAVSLALYKRFKPYLDSPRWKAPFRLEHFMAEVSYDLHVNGFNFDIDKCKELCYTIGIEREKIDGELLSAFSPKVRFIREISPKFTKFGTLNKSDFRWAGPDLSAFNGGPFSLIEYETFNPASPAQIVERLNDAGWKPTEKTKGHLQALRDSKSKDDETKQLALKKLEKFARTGWTVSEENLKTLPPEAPEAAKKLARRILLASRERTLTEWINAYREDGRIHGRPQSIGAWTHRMAHQDPNTGNIPRDDATFGIEMRSMWNVPDGSYLVGVDAEGIQLRVLAHYINDLRFTQSVVSGRKEDGTDPHSLNKQALGEPCKSRNDAKTFIYAWLLGAGIGKVADILGCSYGEAVTANENFLRYYPGLQLLKSNQIPQDAARGFFEGFDGRYVRIFGDDRGAKEHFCLAGYLQNGEVCVMKRATEIWYPRLKNEGIPFKLVNLVHDEWQNQVDADYDTALYVANVMADSIRQAGEDFNLRCPMAGSILGGHGKIAIGRTWYETH